MKRLFFILFVSNTCFGFWEIGLNEGKLDTTNEKDYPEHTLQKCILNVETCMPKLMKCNVVTEEVEINGRDALAINISCGDNSFRGFCTGPEMEVKVTDNKFSLSVSCQNLGNAELGNTMFDGLKMKFKDHKIE